MTPSEKAIQSRIKEAFALKVQPYVWDEIVSQLKFRKSTEFKNANLFQQKMIYKFHKVDLEAAHFGVKVDNNSKMLEMVQIEEDPLISVQTFAIFPVAHPRWVGVDSSKYFG